MRVRLWIPVACAALLLAPAAAHAGFSSEPLRISDDSGDSLLPVTAADAEGSTLVVWREAVPGGRLVRFRRVRPDGSLGRTTTVSDGTMIPTQHVVAFAPGGRALIVWTESTIGTQPRFLRARWIEADDSMGGQLTLRNAGIAASALSPVLTGTTDGDAVVAWRNTASAPTNRAEARRVNATGTLGPLLEPSDGPSTGPVTVAPTAAAGALLAWTGPPALKTMPVDAAGAAGTVQTPVAAGVTSTSLQLTTGGQDRFHVLWAPVGEADQLATMTLDATGAGSGPRHGVEAGVTTAAFPHLATNAANRSLALWSRDQRTAVARFIGPDGVPEAATTSAPAEVQFSQGAALLGDGTGVLLWSQGPLGNVSGVWSRIVGPDGVAAAPQQLAPTAASFPSLAAAPGGVGLVAWEQRVGPPATGSQRHVEARQLLPPPACSDASATVVQGRPTPVALACTGLQLTGPEVLSRPANGTLGAVDPATGSVLYTPRPGFQGADSFTFRGTNKGGPGATRTARIAVGKDTVAPIVQSFRLNRKRVRLRTAFLARTKRKPAFALRLSEPATAVITLQRKRGTRFRAAGSRSLTTAATSATMRLGKRVGKRRLVPGAYRATVVATDLAGNRSRAKRVLFVVTRR